MPSSQHQKKGGRRKRGSSAKTTTTSTTSTTTTSTIKGYLPVRVWIPTSWKNHWNTFAASTHNDNSDDDDNDNDNQQQQSRAWEETFLYVKEHQGSSSTPEQPLSSSSSSSSSTTLFVANAPLVPGIRTKLVLQSLLGRYGEIRRVTVVPHPRRGHYHPKTSSSKDSTVLNHINNNSSSSSSITETITSAWTTQIALPSFLGTTRSDSTNVLDCNGKFAHVVMDSPKDLRVTLERLAALMEQQHSVATNQQDDSTKKQQQRPPLPGLLLDRIELQTLADETDRWYQSLASSHQNNDSDDDDDDCGTTPLKLKTPVAAVAARYRATQISRSVLLAECNKVVQEWEDAEAADRQARLRAAQEPDEDGFVTVTYNTSSSQRDLEASYHKEDDDDDNNNNNNQVALTTRRKRQKRSRKKKGNSGATELADFYRFQTKETRKRTLHELRDRFQEDLAKVKKMKEDKQYKPF